MIPPASCEKPHGHGHGAQSHITVPLEHAAVHACMIITMPHVHAAMTLPRAQKMDGKACFGRPMIVRLDKFENDNLDYKPTATPAQQPKQ